VKHLSGSWSYSKILDWAGKGWTEILIMKNFTAVKSFVKSFVILGRRKKKVFEKLYQLVTTAMEVAIGRPD
jgi:hypothetical protein